MLYQLSSLNRLKEARNYQDKPLFEKQRTYVVPNSLFLTTQLGQELAENFTLSYLCCYLRTSQKATPLHEDSATSLLLAINLGNLSEPQEDIIFPLSFLEAAYLQPLSYPGDAVIFPGKGCPHSVDRSEESVSRLLVSFDKQTYDQTLTLSTKNMHSIFMQQDPKTSLAHLLNFWTSQSTMLSFQIKNVALKEILKSLAGSQTQEIIRENLLAFIKEGDNPKIDIHPPMPLSKIPLISTMSGFKWQLQPCINQTIAPHRDKNKVIFIFNLDQEAIFYKINHQTIKLEPHQGLGFHGNQEHAVLLNPETGRIAYRLIAYTSYNHFPHPSLLKAKSQSLIDTIFSSRLFHF